MMTATVQKEAPTTEADIEAIETAFAAMKLVYLAYGDPKEFDICERAYVYARRSHEGQRRMSGEPYIIHPIEVGKVLAEHRFDAMTIAAALLHDVEEDCGVTDSQLAENFGPEVAGMVAGVTKISSISPQTRQETQAENLRRMLVAVARDVRVLLIKLADRLHNMRTINALDRERIERISRETLEIYAPLADRMGMSTVRTELEDRGFRALEPERYDEIRVQMQGLLGGSMERKREAEDHLTERLREVGIKAEVASRTKEIYSVHKKMVSQNRPITEIFDLQAMRVIVESVRECYAALGIVHTIWKPIPKRFKDYIAMPKTNMYQALHTTVIGPAGALLEIQIKSQEMHLVAEEGIAAHWKYKSQGPVDERLGWLKQILEWQRDAVSAKEFMDSLKMDLYSDKVFVVTPRGDIIDLPGDASPIDMAFHIHTEIGLHLSGAKVDGRIVPITSKLRSGQVVEIITSKTARPSLSWLEAAKSPRARQKIRHFLREQGADELRRHGASLLQAALDRRRLRLSVAKESPRVVETAQAMGYRNLESLLEAVGFGSEAAEGVVRRVEEAAPPKAGPRCVADAEKRAAEGAARRSGSAVVIDGVSDLVVRFAACCQPIPGDGIIGYLTRGRGVSVHRADCPALRARRDDPARKVSAQWAKSSGRFAARVAVECEDRIGILADVSRVIAEKGGNIVTANIRTRELGHDLFSIEVDDNEQLDVIIQALSTLPGIRSVARAVPEERPKGSRRRAGRERRKK